jgi:Zn-dependent protease with chaperone function
MSPVSATYFDGQRSYRHSVTFDVSDGIAFLVGEGVQRSAPLATLEITDALGDSPRLVRFSDGAYCEIHDHQALARILGDQMVQRSVVARWEASNPLWIAASIVGLLAVLASLYLYGVPFVSAVVAYGMPPVVIEKLSTETLEVLDSQVFEDTRIPASRQTQLLAEFDRLSSFDRPQGARYRLLFRDSPLLGANAMALPSGIIVITDSLIEHARDDREILGVLAHEAGHVDRQHGLRLFVESSVVALFVAWYLGDSSALIAIVPTTVLQAKYSRDLEREADAYAARMLKTNGISLEYLASFLERLDATSETTSGSAAALQYLSTHPATKERLDHIRSQ